MKDRIITLIPQEPSYVRVLVDGRPLGGTGDEGLFNSDETDVILGSVLAALGIRAHVMTIEEDL